MRTLTALTAVVIGTASLAVADGPPTMGESGPRPIVSSPYWNGSPASDLPAADIRTVPAAHANAARAYATYQQSAFDLSNATRVARLHQDREPAYVKAVADEKAAYDDLTRARAAALTGLAENSAYNGRPRCTAP